MHTVRFGTQTHTSTQVHRCPLDYSNRMDRSANVERTEYIICCDRRPVRVWVSARDGCVPGWPFGTTSSVLWVSPWPDDGVNYAVVTNG